MILNELENLEKSSLVQMVTIVTQKSSNYKLASCMIAIFTTFLISFLLVINDYFSALELLQIQLLIFTGIYIVLERFKKPFIQILPKFYKHKIASQYAHNQFENLNININKQKIMFFISLEEKYVEIFADEEISKVIPNNHWQNIVDEFLTKIKENQFENGYLEAVTACSSILAKEFPKESK